MASEHETDVTVLGGGPAGVAAAITLARRGARVALVEKRRAPGFKPGEIIEPTIRQALAEIGIGEGFASLGFPRLAGSVSRWDGADTVETPGMLHPLGHGVLVDRVRLEAWLLQEARRAGVRVHLGATRPAASPDGRGWRIAVVPGVELTADFVVEATGRASGVVAPPARRWHDRLVALLAYPAAPAAVRDRRLHIEAADEGWWYAALLPDQRLVLALVTDAETLRGLSANARRDWFRERALATGLAEALLQEQAGPTLEATAVRGYPAGSSLRKVITGPGWVATGEAAATYDPLSGCGVPMALAKGAATGRLLASCDRAVAMRRYAEAEEACFQDYLVGQKATYLRAARRRSSRFWLGWRNAAVAT